MSLFRRHPHPDNLDDTDEDEEGIDPDLRLRTVQTAASAIAESIRSEARIQQRRKRKSFRKPGKGRLFGGSRIVEKKDSDAESTMTAATKKVVAGIRRNIYVNLPLPEAEQELNGDPAARYPRNKVRTSKYTILTFIPKNLYEQFRRVANLYFLALVCFQVFPIFGAAAPQIAMLPLVVILTFTALKDGIEDYRRASLDDEVNNSAATKLGDWRNVNQPKDPRNWFQRLLNIGPAPGKASKGVRKLREKEALQRQDLELHKEGSPTQRDVGTTSMDSSDTGRGGDLSTVRSLDDIYSVSDDSRSMSIDHSYPPTTSPAGPSSTSPSSSTVIGPSDPGRFPNIASSYAISTLSHKSVGVVDWQRQTPGTARWERTLWKKLEVGDLVLLRDNDQVPADIVVLSTSDADGLCYIETKNLDGETNLKPRRSLKATCTITSEEDLEHAAFYLDSEPPHPNLYSYNGVLKYSNRSQPDEAEKMEPVTINELLLRGCTVRNTSWIVGLVAFTGPDTKIMLNGGDTPSKRSKIEKETNFNVIMNFIILILMCTVTAIVSGWYNSKSGTSADFFEIDAEPTHSPAINALVTFVSCLIAFQNIVPISLYISIEIVKTIQAYFISQDIDMYYAPYDTTCVPKTWNISDDLGQIEYIFSDKTGTLTQNIMEFQKCSVNGVAYGEGVTEAMRGAAKRQGLEDGLSVDDQHRQLAALKDDMVQTMTRSFKNRYQRADRLTLISPKLAEHLNDRSSPQRGHLIAFFRALAVCHSVLPDKPNPQNEPFTVDYKAESPDEAALVAAARDVGFPFIGRNNTGIDIEVMGQAERYIPLRVLEFNSTRKRMSVIVRNPDGKIVLYCKGADSVIYSRLARDHDPELKATTTRDLEAFANGGLRTLCISYRYMTEEEYFEWSRKYDAATNAIQDREDEIDKACELVEHGLTILGATALEDKLQEGVPETIETLHKAGIKLWILTGDKQQTAIEIGFSCNLLKRDTEIMILSADSPEAARSKIEAGLNKIASIVGPPSFDNKGRPRPTSGSAQGFAVVIDGDTLRYALEPALKPLFLNLGTQCETVVCCRVSPAQKALTVKLVKEGRNAMTLSIGDGANDVAMIQEANIGCGLFGLEGSQAAMSADYAFGQFRFLAKLLLVHGRWSYQRIADMHSNFFYKNVIWTFAMFWFLFWNSFDATYLYEYTFILLYNLAFTSLPVIVLGAFDQDINAKASLSHPQLYKRGILGLEYTRTQFWLYMFDGLYQSAIVYFLPYLIWSVGLPVSASGKGVDSLSDFGTTVSVAAIFAANIFVGINIRYWTAITWVIIIGSMLLLILWITIYSFFNTIDFNDEIGILFQTIDFWTGLVLSVVLAVGPRYLAKAIHQIYFPLDKDIVREMWVAGDLKDRLGIEHRYRKKRKGRQSIHAEADTLYRAGTNLEAGGVAQHSPTENTTLNIPYTSGLTPKSSPAFDPTQRLLDGQADNAPLRLDPSHTHPNRNSPTSPNISYYSPSEIPLSLDATTPPLSRRPSTRSPDAPRDPNGEYEMRVRSPQQTEFGQLEHQQMDPSAVRNVDESTAASHATYATAHEEPPWDADHDSDGNHHRQRSSEYGGMAM